MNTNHTVVVLPLHGSLHTCHTVVLPLHGLLRCLWNGSTANEKRPVHLLALITKTVEILNVQILQRIHKGRYIEYSQFTVLDPDGA